MALKTKKLWKRKKKKRGISRGKEGIEKERRGGG